MNNQITAEDCYQIYHKAKMFAQKGIYPKAIKNWEPIKGRPTWPYFEKLADMLHRSAGRIDPKEYIETIVNFYPKSIEPKILITQKGIKAYKASINKVAMESTDEYKVGQLKNDLVFVYKFCVNNNLDTFRDYFHHNAAVYPSLVAHYESRRISPYFVYLIPNLNSRLESYPSDVRHDNFNDKFWSECSIFNILVNGSQELTMIKENLEQIIKELIQKNNKRTQ